MSEVHDIRNAYKMGNSLAEISRKTGRDVKTIKKYLNMEKSNDSPKPPIVKPSILDPFKFVIVTWLTDDTRCWFKQHHTAQRIFDRLRMEEGYQGSYSTVQRFVRKYKLDHPGDKRGYQELVWHPGEAQVDTGEADFIVSGQRRRLKFLTISFPYSNFSLTQIVQDVSALSICQALKDIFTYIGGVPKLLVFDNASGVGRKVHGKVMENQLFSRFRTHYVFDLRFCNPYSGHEKGNVESKIGDTRRNLFVPVRSFVDVKSFNQKLLQECDARGAKKHYKKGVPIYELFEEEKTVLSFLPTHDFDVCEYRNASTDKYGRVQVGTKHFYGTRPELAGHELLVRIRTDTVTIFDEKQREIETYARAFGSKYTEFTNVAFSLKHLSNHPGAWFNSKVRESMKPDFQTIIDNLDAYRRKKLLKTLNTLSEVYGYELATQAIQEAFDKDNLDFDTIATLAARLKDGGIDLPPSKGPSLKEYDAILQEASK